MDCLGNCFEPVQVQSGGGIVFTSHTLEEALNHADRITVLRDGEKVAGGQTSNFDRDSLIRAMVGRSLSKEIYGTRAGDRNIRKPGRKVLGVSNLSMESGQEQFLLGLWGLIPSVMVFDRRAPTRAFRLM